MHDRIRIGIKHKAWYKREYEDKKFKNRKCYMLAFLILDLAMMHMHI